MVCIDLGLLYGNRLSNVVKWFISDKIVQYPYVICPKETTRAFRWQKRTTEKDRKRLEKEGTIPSQRGQDPILPQKM
jgi:hypothetical protein